MKDMLLTLWNFCFNKWIQIVMSFGCYSGPVAIWGSDSALYGYTRHIWPSCDRTFLESVRDTCTPVISPVRFLQAKQPQALELLHQASHPAAPVTGCTQGAPQRRIYNGVQNSGCPGNIKIYIGCPHPYKSEPGDGTQGAGPWSYFAYQQFCR